MMKFVVPSVSKVRRDMVMSKKLLNELEARRPVVD
jgi:hypothetical protein